MGIFDIFKKNGEYTEYFKDGEMCSKLNYNNYWKSLFALYDNAKNLNFGNKNLQSISLNVTTLKEFKSLFN